MKSKATGCGSISTAFSSIVLLCVNNNKNTAAAAAAAAAAATTTTTTTSTTATATTTYTTTNLLETRKYWTDVQQRIVLSQEAFSLNLSWHINKNIGAEAHLPLSLLVNHV